MLHFLSVYTQLSIMKKSKIKQKTISPTPFLKQNKTNIRAVACKLHHQKLVKKNSCKIFVSHINNRVDLKRQIEIRKQNVKKKAFKECDATEIIVSRTAPPYLNCLQQCTKRPVQFYLSNIHVTFCAIAYQSKNMNLSLSKHN